MIKAYIFVFLTILLTVYGQLVIKARAIKHATTFDKTQFLFEMFLDPWVLSGLFAALAASATWMMAVQSNSLSLVYPLMALTFVIIPLLAVVLFGEHLNKIQILGLVLIVAGVFFSSSR
jgi:drug/metabolite transporter (DMT)-like permease